MSYILEALSKGEKLKTEKSINENFSDSGSVNGNPRSPVDPLPPAQQQIFTTPTIVSHQSIAWGVLLTLAIFSALIAGFWLGQQKAELNSPNVKLTENVSPADTGQQRNVNIEGRSASFEETNTLTKTQNKALSPTVKLAAEDYFDNPPVANAPVNIEASIDTNTDEIEQKILTPQKKALTAENIKFDVKPSAGVSDDILARFQSAIAETEGAEKSINAGTDEQTAALPLNQMPEWVQQGVPSLNLEMHIYASDGEGWIRVNGDDRYEGQQINNDLSVEKILPQKVVLNFRGELFTLVALSTWK
ncbi:general secretion pathway protein GspB [Colwelliaceae bacterium 6471]